MKCKRFPTSLIVVAMLGFIAVTGAADAPAPATEDTSKRSAAPASSPARTGSKKLAHVDDLEGKRIGALQGSAHVEYVERTWPQGNAAAIQHAGGSRARRQDRQSRCGVERRRAPAGNAARRQNPGRLGASLFSFPEGVGFRKGNSVLREQFNRFLAELKQSGIHADMVDRWMESNVTDSPAIPDAASSGELVVGVSDGALPFMAVKDNKLIGFEIELAERFGAYLGRKVRFSQIDFSGLIAAVATGKVDMIVAAIFITDERKQSIDSPTPTTRRRQERSA